MVEVEPQCYAAEEVECSAWARTEQPCPAQIQRVLRETALLHRYGKNGLILGFVFRIECKMPAYFHLTIKFKVRRNVAALVSFPRPGATPGIWEALSPPKTQRLIQTVLFLLLFRFDFSHAARRNNLNLDIMYLAECHHIFVSIYHVAGAGPHCFGK